ncbi:MAG: single-stranded-DNA-specific exonuclease RecJ [Ideonella sp.]
MKPATIALREVPPRAAWALEQAGLTPLLARLFAGRGVRMAEELDDGLARLIPPSELLGATAAARRLADALQSGESIVVVADYDCDGATACAVAVRGLRLLGAQPGQVRYVVPDRAVHGYGLTPTIVDLALRLQPPPKVLITVDNGIASIDGVAHARQRGLGVIVTDHHLPAIVDGAIVLPEADVIVNPNQPDCKFASKQLAGVGVMFYVLLALRSELRDRGRFDAQNQPRLDSLLDLVALGTVADVVRLDANNRRLVAQGLKRIRSGRLHAGVAALFAVAGRDARRASAFDFGFALGPRINAAGRLSDMALGIECLLCDDPSHAAELASRLDAINRERRDVEAGMREQAELLLDALLPTDDELSALTLYDPGFHEGVVGIVASRLKDRLNRPSFVFARGQDGLLKGSGRSIAGFHLRDALDLLTKRHPGVLRKFGGHAMAAGCTLDEAELPTFRQGLALIASEWLTPALLSRTVLSDGPLGAEHFNASTVAALDEQVWGQAFEPPVFCDEVDIVSQRLVGEKHLKLSVRHAGTLRDAIWFGHSEPLPARVRLAYRLSLDEYNGRQRIQMMVEAAVPVVAG